MNSVYSYKLYLSPLLVRLLSIPQYVKSNKRWSGRPEAIQLTNLRLFSFFVSSETALQICHLHVCLWTFCICNSLFSTILITMDRYVYITKCMKYPVLVTKERVILSIALSWTLSLVISSMPLLIRCKSDSRMYDGRCIYNHVVPTYFAAFIATMILTILFLVYVLYFNILVKYYKKRNRLLEARKRTGTVRMTSAFHEAASSKRCSVSSLVATTNMGPATVGIDHHGTSNSLLRDVKFGSKSSKDKFLVVKKLGKVADFIHAIHYVIFLILAFTLAWLPYLIVLSTDIVADWKRDYLRDCGLDSDSVRDFSVSNLNYSTQVHQHLQEAAMEDLLALVCDKGIDESHVCGLVHLALHSQRQNLMQKTAVIIGVLHSIVNPIIYAFWYPQFRHQVLGLCRLFHSK